MLIGYDTSNLPDHDPVSAIGLLKTIGYRAFAIRIDTRYLTRYHSAHEIEQHVLRIRTAIGKKTPVILDIDAPYLLDPWKADEPSLVGSSDTTVQSRIDLILEAIALSPLLNDATVVFSSGMLLGSNEGQEADMEVILERLARRIDLLIRSATDASVRLAIRPKIAHVIGSIANFERLLQWLEHPEALRLAGDIGVMASNGEFPSTPVLSRHLARLDVVFLGDDRYVDYKKVVYTLTQGGFHGSWILYGQRCAEDPVALATSRYNQFNPE